MLFRECPVGQHVRLGLIHDGGELGQLGPDLVRHGAPLGAGGFGSCAKAVAMKAATMQRPDFPAGVGTFLMKCTLQRCLWARFVNGFTSSIYTTPRDMTPGSGEDQRIACAAPAGGISCNYTAADKIIDVAQGRILGTLRERCPFRGCEFAFKAIEQPIDHHELAVVERCHSGAPKTLPEPGFAAGYGDAGMAHFNVHAANLDHHGDGDQFQAGGANNDLAEAVFQGCSDIAAGQDGLVAPREQPLKRS